MIFGAGIFAWASSVADSGKAATGDSDVVATSPEPDEPAAESRWAQPHYPGARILIDATGGVFVDDMPATPALLHEAFSNLLKYNGVVWYHRENPELEPEGTVAQAVDEVIAVLKGYPLAVELFEAGFPDPEAHWQTLENPPPRHSDESASPEAE